MTKVSPDATTFRHEALLYDRPEAFVSGVGGFVAEGLALGERVLVLVTDEKAAALRGVLGARADEVTFADVDVVGRNPGRIIPLWSDFLECGPGGEQSVRGVGEPVDARRDADELAECDRHEALLNVAFADAPPWRLLCPYDVSALAASVVDAGLRNHPFLTEDDTVVPNPEALGLDAHRLPFTAPLSPVPNVALRFEVGSIGRFHAVRESVVGVAEAAGVERSRLGDVALVVDELVANSMRHGTAWAAVTLWSTGSAFVCDVRDGGHIRDPLAGRRRPDPDAETGRGLWLVHQLSDLVQQRDLADGNVTRVRFRTGD